jgi:hypothetical protein
MNCQIKLNGTDISDKVISYSREHKICTGIGMLTLITTYELHGSFSPWDHIEIYEGGSREGSYYVSITDDSKPDSNITVTAQDNSKRLTDYFIAETYIITYPTYALYWITKFLTEMGINYDFNVDDDGSLLSNNTQLGLVSGYEQIMMLLQISGWYIKFNSNDKAIIGKLNSDLRSKARFNKDDIIDIHVVTHDKLLRNRVVVWGKNRPTIGWVTAEAKKITGWNYDNQDYRTLVISNSCIPTDYAAEDLAWKALAEFTKPNKEKHVTAIGTWGINIGDFVTVRSGSGVFNGKGLVTTFGTSMSSAGLITKVTLDERCPRLFAYFDFSGDVYISTAESGIWRKNIHGDTWEDYSEGLSSNSITDLHISANVMAAVTRQGQAEAALTDYSGWSLVPISGLEASGISQGGTTVVSGFMTRACIVDRLDNSAKFAVDTAPWENSLTYEPYPSGLMSQIFASGGNGILMNSSGFVMENMRSWVVEYDAVSGIVLGSTQVVINSTASGQAGSNSVIVFDIENDGETDYLSAMIKGSGLYSFVSSPLNMTYDINNKVTLSGFLVSDRITISGVLASGVVVGSGNHYVRTLTDYNPYTEVHETLRLNGYPDLNQNGFPSWIYKEESTELPNGPWGMSFYTVNGNPSVVYRSLRGLTLLEMPTIPVVSGYMITPVETTILHNTNGLPSDQNILGIVRVTPNEFDIIGADQFQDLNYYRWDTISNTIKVPRTKFGELVHRKSSYIYLDYAGCIHQLRVGDFVYFVSFAETYEGIDGLKVISAWLEIVDLQAKTVKSQLYFKTSGLVDNTTMLGPISLYQTKEKIGMTALIGTNDGTLAYPGHPEQARHWKNTNVYDGVCLPGNFPTLNLMCTQAIIEGAANTWQGYPVGYPLEQLPSFMQHNMNPNVCNFISRFNTGYYVDYGPPIGIIRTKSIGWLVSRVDGKYYTDTTEIAWPYGSYEEEVAFFANPEALHTRSQLVGNPAEYNGFGYANSSTEIDTTGFTEGASLYGMRNKYNLPAGWERITIFNGQDTLTSGVFSLMRADNGDHEIWEDRPDGTHIEGIPFYGMPSGWSRVEYTGGTGVSGKGVYGVSALNFFVVFPAIDDLGGAQKSSPVINFYYSPLLMSGYSYATLQETSSGFQVIDYYDKVPRLDISKYSPLVVATDSVSSIQTIYPAAGTLTEPSLIVASGSDDRLVDFRYTDFALSGYPSGTPTEDLYEESTLSGLMTERRLIFVTLSGLYHSPIDDIEQQVLIFGMSGITQLETTNNSFDYQYFFVSTSGEDSYNFYQKDNVLNGTFVAFPSGLPQSLVTRIRVDDLI